MKSTMLFLLTSPFIQFICLGTQFQSYRSSSPESLINVLEAGRLMRKRS